MAKCMSCGKNAILTAKFGTVVLCKNCGSLINVSVWNTREFVSLEELIIQKNNAIQKANASNMPLTIINKINDFFDEYINAGFITSINGKAGQILKVFSKHCIVTTKSESKKEELENMFYQFDEEDDDELLSADDRRNLVKGLLSGKIVQAGIGAAMSATLNQYEKEKIEEKKSHERHRNIARLISVGDRRIDLRNISEIEIFSKANTVYGYFKFIKKGASPQTLYDCEYFFFNNSIPLETKKIKKKLGEIRNILNERIAVVEKEPIIPTSQKSKAINQNKSDGFKEIRKYKQLLDEGIISEEEFNFKKKQLLDL